MKQHANYFLFRLALMDMIFILHVISLSDMITTRKTAPNWQCTSLRYYYYITMVAYYVGLYFT